MQPEEEKGLTSNFDLERGQTKRRAGEEIAFPSLFKTLALPWKGVKSFAKYFLNPYHNGITFLPCTITLQDEM